MVKKQQHDACKPKKLTMKKKSVIQKGATSSATSSKKKDRTDKPLAYRSSLTFISNLVNVFKFSKIEITSLKKLPFWLTLKPFIEGKIENREQVGKKNSVIKKLLETYSVADKGFKVGSKIIRITKEGFENLFGVVGGELVIDLPNRLARPNSSLADLIPKSNDGQLRYNMLYEALKVLKNNKRRGKETEQYADNVAKIVCLMLLSNLFLPSSTASLKWGWLRIVDDLAGIKKYDWSGNIITYLTRSLEEVKGEYGLCKGFVPLVLYLFAEHATDALQLKKEDDKVIPSFLRWNSSHLCDKFGSTDFSEPEIGEKFNCTELEDVNDEPANDLKKRIHGFEKKIEGLKKKISKMKKKHKLERDAFLKRIEELQNKADVADVNAENDCDDNEIVKVNAKKDGDDEADEENAGMDVDGDDEETIEVNAGMEGDGEVKTTMENDGEVNAAMETAIVLYGDDDFYDDSTLAKHIKKRTMLNTRKRKLVFTLSGKKRAKKSNKCKEPESSEAVVEAVPIMAELPQYKPLNFFKKYIDLEDEVKNEILKIHKISRGFMGHAYFIFPNVKICLIDIMAFFKEEYLRDTVIDAWSFILEDIQNQFLKNYNYLADSTVCGKSFFMSALIWQEFMVNKDKPERFEKRIFSNIEHSLLSGYRFIHFPIISAGSKSANEMGNHWTLLVLDIINGHWKFFNSLRPRSKENADLYFTDAKLLIDWIKGFISRRMSCYKALNNITSNANNVTQMQNSPKQDGTADCGFIIMYIMTCYAEGGEIPQRISHVEMKRFKKRILEAFVKTSHVATMDKNKGKEYETISDIIKDLNEYSPVDLYGETTGSDV